MKKEGGCLTFACSAAARLFASFSAFFARPLSFFAFPPLGAMDMSAYRISKIWLAKSFEKVKAVVS
jgi:hypothetical protein